jgi:hypothetical protein
MLNKDIKKVEKTMNLDSARGSMIVTNLASGRENSTYRRLKISKANKSMVFGMNHFNDINSSSARGTEHVMAKNVRMKSH